MSELQPMKEVRPCGGKRLSVGLVGHCIGRDFYKFYTLPVGQLKQQSVPKKKFAFKSKKAVALQPPTLAVNKITARDVKKQKSTEAEENQCEEKTTQKDILAPGIQNVTGEKNVTLAGKDVDGQDLIVENISNCRIRLSHSLLVCFSASWRTN